MTLHVQVIRHTITMPLLDQIQHYLMDHYQIEHATIQMNINLPWARLPPE